MSYSQDESKDTVYEDIKKLKIEVDDLQNTIEILMAHIYQEESIKKSLEDIKADIKVSGASKKYI